MLLVVAAATAVCADCGSAHLSALSGTMDCSRKLLQRHTPCMCARKNINRNDSAAPVTAAFAPAVPPQHPPTNTRRRPRTLATPAHPASSSWGGARRGPGWRARQRSFFFLDFARAHDHTVGFPKAKPQFVCSLPTLLYASHRLRLHTTWGTFGAVKLPVAKNPNRSTEIKKLFCCFALQYTFFILETIEMRRISTKSGEFSLVGAWVTPLLISAGGPKMSYFPPPKRLGSPTKVKVVPGTTYQVGLPLAA